MGIQTLVPNQYRLHKWDGSLDIRETGGAMVTGNIAIIPPDDADINVQSLSVTENGTYTAADGTAYSPVTVNVPTAVKPEQEKSVNVSDNGIVEVEPDADYVLTKVTVTVSVTNRLRYTLHESQALGVSHVIYFAEDVLDAGSKTGYISSGTGASALEQITVTVSSADSNRIVGSYTYDGISYSDVNLAKLPAHDIVVS